MSADTPAAATDGVSGTQVPQPVHLSGLSTLSPADSTTVLEAFQVEDPPSPIRSKARLYAILAALYTSLFIAALDQTIIATAVPTIAAQLKSGSGYTWIGGAYLLANAAAAPIIAKLSDIWGRKPIFLASVALFFFSSLMCALSVSMAMLIAGRSIQGIAGGGLFQMVAIIISDLFSVKERTIYFGFMEVVWALASGLGPVLGGVFAQKLSWRWCFYINLPISASAFLLLFLFLNVHNPRTNLVDGLKAMDWIGMTAILGLVLMLLLGLEFGGATFPWDSPKVICLIVFGALFSIIFIYVEKRLAKYPLIPMTMFENRSNVAALAITFLHAFVFIAPEYWLPLYFQSIKEASPLRSGVLLIPLVLTAAIAGMFTGFLLSRTSVSYREIIWAGTGTLTLGTGLLIILQPNTTIGAIVGLQIIAGIGAGLLFQPPVIAVQVHTAQDDVATATATLGFMREIAAAVSIIIGGVIFQNSMKGRAMDLKAAGASAELIHQLSGVEAASNTRLVREIQDDAVRAAVKEAFAWSLRNMWIMYTCVAVLGVVASAFISKKALSTEHTETRTGLKEKSKSRIETSTGER